jgi:hypothetical protein
VCAEGRSTNGDALAFVKRSIDNREQEKIDREQSKSRERQDLKQKYDAVLVKGDTPHRWTLSELKTMVQWFNLPTDHVVSARNQDMLWRY